MPSIVQEIFVSPRTSRFSIIAGETKWRAATMLTTEGVLVTRAGQGDSDDDTIENPKERITLPELLVPFVVEDVNSDDAQELSFVENDTCTNLNPLDEVMYYHKHRLRTGEGLKTMAARFQKDKRIITKRLALLKMGDDCQALLVARPDTFFSALRIGEVKEPTLRGELIAAAESGTA